MKLRCLSQSASQVQHNIKIASGFAKGIDTAAHEVCVKDTIVVLAGGIDHIYPSENQRLYKQIIDAGGLIIAEKPFGACPLPKDFPLRNRIISGVSVAAAIIEAGLKSGALITARQCLDQGK
jgi:DNA processing protein